MMKRLYNFFKNKSIWTGYAFLLIFFFSSCSDVLDITPTDSYTEEVVWNDEAFIKSFISHTYRLIPNVIYDGFQNLSVLTDEQNSRSNALTWSINAGEITPSSFEGCNWDYWSNNTRDDWDWDAVPNLSYWKPINETNSFFKNFDKSKLEDVDEAILNRMIGEMKAIRAYSYFKLISFFGGVPLITTPFELGEDFSVPKNSYAEVMDFVLSELDEAIPLLPLEYGPEDQGRITKGAAMAIKARALLYYASPLNNPNNDVSRWQAAADAAKKIIDLKEYALFDDYRTMFIDENIYNCEMIWQRPYNQHVSYEYVYAELSSYPNGYNGYGEVHPLQNIVDDYEMLSGLLPKDDPSYDPQNPYVNRDPRFEASILHDGFLWKGREVETFISGEDGVPGGKDSNEGPVSAWNATETGYYQRKFSNEKITDPSEEVMSQAPWTWFRYGEVLLNYAEANYFLGNEAIAREYVNMIRRRPSVNMPDITASGDELFQKIVHERRIELAFEEHRWFDVRRLKIAPQVLNTDFTRMEIKKFADGHKTYEVKFWKKANFAEPRDYLFPIPQSEIDKNANLIQNPGY
jgi:hypothetical protein